MPGPTLIVTAATSEYAVSTPFVTTARKSVGTVRLPVTSGLSAKAISLVVVQLSSRTAHFSIAPVWPARADAGAGVVAHRAGVGRRRAPDQNLAQSRPDSD